MLLTLVDPPGEGVEFNSVVDSVSTLHPANCFFHAFLTCNTLINKMLLALKIILEIFIQQDCRTHEYNRAINLYVCTSLFSKMAKISMATPCKQLRMLKRYWKAIVLLFTDEAPNIHVNPSSGVRINPPLNATLQAVHGFGSMYKIYQNYY